MNIVQSARGAERRTALVIRGITNAAQTGHTFPRHVSWVHTRETIRERPRATPLPATPDVQHNYTVQYAVVFNGR